MSTRWGTRSRRGAGLVMALLIGALVAGCAPDEPFERLVDDRDASADAVVAAEAFASMLGDLETTVGVSPAPDGTPDARATVDAMADAATSHAPMGLGSQARAFFEGHASQVARDTRTSGLSSAHVTVVSVTEADDADGPVALVTVDTVRTPLDGPAITVRSAYALSWDEGQVADPGQPSGPASSTGASPEAAGPPEPGASTGTEAPQPPAEPAGPDERPRLEQVRALHDDDGHHALVDAEAHTSVLGIASDYVRALRSGTDQEVDALEGGVRSSADLREALRGRLAVSGRMTPVEVPCGRTGTVQVVYVVLDGDVPPLRLEVDTSGERPVVNAYL